MINTITLLYGDTILLDNISIGDGAYVSCSSPYIYINLEASPGTHVLSVKDKTFDGELIIGSAESEFTIHGLNNKFEHDLLVIHNFLNVESNNTIIMDSCDVLPIEMLGWVINYDT